jgi:DNA modification methylase
MKKSVERYTKADCVLEPGDRQHRRLNQIPSDLGPTRLVAVSSLRFSKSFKNYSVATAKKAASFIETFGLRVPILVDADHNVVCGEIWALAHKRLELPEISVLFVEGLSPDQLKAYRLGMERIPELGDWDTEALAEVFADWSGRDLDFNIELPGFDAPEIDSFVKQFETTAISVDKDDIAQDEDRGPHITKPDDIWKCGHHVVLCGDSKDGAAFRRLFKNEKATAVVTDPPYNVPVNGHVGGKGEIHHREFAMASGEMTSGQFIDFLLAFMRNCISYSVDGSLHYIFMDWRHAQELLRAAGGLYTELKNIAVWIKSNGGMGSFYRSRHELAFIYKSGEAAHRNNVQLGRFGRNRTNVWEYAGANGFGGRKTEEGHLLGMHPTVKPVQMLADILLDCTSRGDVVLDPFLGSGSTLIAAERVGRKLRAIEIDPHYVDLAVRRWQRHTGDQAVNADTGRPFDDD